MAARKVDFTSKRVLNQITKFMQEGYDEKMIAKHYGYSATHFSGLKKQYPELSEAIKNGYIDVEHMVRGKLFEMMLDDKHPKQFSALCFYAKSKLGWSQESNEMVDTSTKRPRYRGLE
jgi:hypothetical protein